MAFICKQFANQLPRYGCLFTRCIEETSNIAKSYNHFLQIFPPVTSTFDISGYLIGVTG